ncbi:hypothetical protein GCM10009838_89040 [Catenulispora subtropica]|uniref:Uncharacterized protein n=1 Tax=Catenulispora subtropica TaxID=450798 RepID=A0ABN2TIT6_9ACTN
MLAKGGAPTPEAVAARLAAVQAAEDRRLLRTVPGPTVAAWIDDYVSRNGRGPLRGEVGREMGWPAGRTERILPALQRQGWISMTSEPRSLRAQRTGPAEEATAALAPQLETVRRPERKSPPTEV